MRGMTEIDTDDVVLEEDWVKLLSAGVFRVEFIKVNGKRSIKIVSLDQALYPKFQNTTGTKRPAVPGTIKCWSFKDKWWRTFLIEHVVSLHKINDPDEYLRKLRHDMAVKANRDAMEKKVPKKK